MIKNLLFFPQQGCQRKEYVGDDGSGQTGGAEPNDESQCRDDQDITQFIVAPRQVRRFQREHGEIRYHEEREEKYQPQNDARVPIARIGKADAYPKERIGRNGEPDKRGALPVVDIEFGQTQSAGNRYQQCDVGQVREASVGEEQVVAQQRVNHETRCQSETYEVGEGVEFFAHGRVGVEQASRQPVEKIAYGSNDDAGGGCLKSAFQGKDTSQAAGQEIAAGNDVGYV